MTQNILMVSADRAVAAGEKGPFHYMLETFSRHWDRIDVIGMRPARRVQDTVFGNVHLHYATGGKLAQAVKVHLRVDLRSDRAAVTEDLADLGHRCAGTEHSGG